jgi:hypothetical protein
MELKQQKKLEDYLIAKNKSYAVYGLTRNEIKSEFLLSDDDVEKYLKRKFCYSIGEAIQLLMKINQNENERE